ncbi:MAG: CoA ester lyase [Pseudomonadota bacterium]|nr:CoA ester lyase [Pseudomonadota bacterium]
METLIKPRRSVLYIPGSNNRALKKAIELPADCLILDLEDSVHPNNKAAARNQIITFLKEADQIKSEIIVRINSLETTWGLEDINAIAKTKVDAILLSKIQTPNDVEVAAKLLSEAGSTETPIWVMAETPMSIINLFEIAKHNRVHVIVMGTSDLIKSLRVPKLENRAGLNYSLSNAVLAARANGLDIIDGVYLELDDTEGFRGECIQGRGLGFDGKSLIHPKQLLAANEIFGITKAEADHAKEIIDAWQAASKKNKGVIVVRGQLVEKLHVDEANRVIKLFSRITKGYTE